MSTAEEKPAPSSEHGGDQYSAGSESPFCRICHEGSAQEELLSPCECTGTLGWVHRSCLEHWLAASNTSYCELCHFQFLVERKPQPLTQWLRNPSPKQERRTLLSDTLCFLFITPLAGISGWLCLRGAADHLESGNRSQLEAAGLIGLTVALLTIYLFWTAVSVRYHIRLYQEWRKTHHRVKLLTPRPTGLPACQNPLLGPRQPSKRLSSETVV
ncbi:E3 ubiquitin-protein ligase MARCHF3 isoform X1 [Lethenteron reissneri]|uniref:E3 ubiquitin-protein ligase MARCHF3 isoform X1 n=1 Tax=Lethenteron reissneri TaxID=7753 RepID=UPI002AB771E0|nr:E3 ubiquitin-protein ligase MARCHF3 isoform X1 [Lethenteron reissneri]XP_061409523.1 E3 ubiquitin-protein ligase MARCHF3 isoform X1 [Lethenteron reissneri]